MKSLSVKLTFVLMIIFMAYSCCKCEEDTLEKEEISIIGEWQLYGSTIWGLEFTNYGIVILKHKPYMNLNFKYTYTETTLTVEDTVGSAVFSEDGDTLTITGFLDPDFFGGEGVSHTIVNGTFIRQ